jgi:hypothetical protein
MKSYTTYVIDDAAATYANAYFELNYINVYSTSSNSSSAAGSSSSSSTTGRPTTTVNSGPGATVSGADEASARPNGGLRRNTRGEFAGLFALAAGMLAFL